MKIKSLLTTGLLALAASTQAATLYVDPVEGDDSKDCNTISDRCKTFKAAFDKSAAGDEILLKQGVHVFSEEQLNIDKELTVKGGYTATFDEITRSKNALATVVEQAPSMTSAYYRFVYITAGIGKWVAFDGFTIRNFNTKNQSDRGTVLLEPNGGNLSLNNIVMHNNKMLAGGAVAVWGDRNVQSGAEVIISNSRFYDNTATGGHGGAIYIRTGINSLTISESSFTSNLIDGESFGGALAIDIGTATLTANISNTTLSNNTSKGNGAAIFVVSGEPNIKLRYSTLVDNKSTSGSGGGVYVTGNGALELMANIISGNQANGAQSNLQLQGGASAIDEGYNLIGSDGSAYAAGFNFTHKDGDGNSTSKAPASATIDFVELAAKQNGGLNGVYTNKLKNGKNSGNPAIDAVPNDGVPFYGVGTAADNPFVSLRQAAATVGMNDSHYKAGNIFYFDLKGRYKEDYSFEAGSDASLKFTANVDADGWVQKPGLDSQYWDEDRTDSELRVWVRQIGGVCSGLIPTDARGMPRADKVKSTEPPSHCDIGAFEYNDYYQLDCEDEDGMRPENNPKSVSVNWCFNPFDKDLTPQDVLENIGLGAFNWYWSFALLGLLAVRIRK